MFLFDNQSEFFRYPQGGIEEGKEIKLKIYTKRNVTYKPVVKIEKRHDYINHFYEKVAMEWVGTEKSYDLYEVAFMINDYGQYYYSFVFNENIASEVYELLVHTKDYTTPDWIKGGIIYHIFVDRFYKTKLLNKSRDIVIRKDWGGTPVYLPDEFGEVKNNDFFGGNLEGIRKKLPYIHSLGVNTIYLSPVFKAYSNHRYDVGDYFSIDTMLGDEKSLKKLCKEAEAYGINIILDGVFSHTGADSIYFNKYGNYNSQGAFQSKDSPYYNWYTFNKWNDDYNSWWGIKTLPTIKKDCDDYINFITGENGVLKYWQKAGIKGWRLDVADELPNEFLKKLRAAVKQQDNDAVIVGEVWEDASNKFSYGKLKEYFCGNQLDSVTNYPLMNAIIDYVKNKDCNTLYTAMNLIVEKYPPHAINCLMNILGTHDTARILTALGSDDVPKTKEERAVYKLNEEELINGIKLLKIASLLQFTLPGVPCIYYGDEAGIEGFEDPFNRRCFPWGNENEELLNHYKFLSQLRKNPLLANGQYRCLLHDVGIFVFERYDDKRLIVAVNMNEKTCTLKFDEKMKEFGTDNLNNIFNLNSINYLILTAN